MGPRTKRAASRATPSPASLSDEDRARVARALAHARGARGTRGGSGGVTLGPPPGGGRQRRPALHVARHALVVASLLA